MAEKSEKATPKKREDARKKGQVARSQDLAGAVVLMATLLALPAVAPMVYEQVVLATRRALGYVSDPSIVSERGIWDLMGQVAVPTALAVAPVAAACMVTGVIVNVVQVGLKPIPFKADAKKLNPINGFKQIFGPNLLFEAGKGVTKVALVGAIAAIAVLPRLKEIGSLVGMPAQQLLPEVARNVLGVAQRAGFAYCLIAVGDFLYQRWRHDKQLRMELQEVKEEMKQMSLPQEVKSKQRQLQRQAAGGRMMDAVPEADVIVVNPTHYAVALRYDADNGAPEVVAKGVDHLALKIRAIATAAGVPIVPDPPLARSLHASVDVGRQIPEELYAAVAQVLAFVYRTAGQRRMAGAA